MSIPAGYQLQSTTWENDGDNYKTQILSGLRVEDVWFYLELAKPFSRQGKFGNENIEAADLIPIVQRALAKHPDISTVVRENWLPDPEVESADEYFDDLMDNLREDLLGGPDESYDSNFCRVFEGFKVFYFPVDIKEVTLGFILDSK